MLVGSLYKQVVVILYALVDIASRKQKSSYLTSLSWISLSSQANLQHSIILFTSQAESSFPLIQS